MSERVLIIVATKDRQEVVRHCFENLAAVKGARDVLAIWNDNSTEYDGAWCRLFGDLVFNTTASVGIHRQRMLHFQFAEKMLERDPSFTRVYMTDADCLHDPSALPELIRIQDKYDGALVCGYDTEAHSCLEGNTWRDIPSEEVIWRKYAPGVSYLMTTDHVATVCGHLQLLNGGWDWQVPSLLGHRCAITRVGYVDHLGVGGDRHPVDAGPDGGDRVKRPTAFLKRKRAEIVAGFRLTKG